MTRIRLAVLKPDLIISIIAQQQHLLTEIHLHLHLWHYIMTLLCQKT